MAAPEIAYKTVYIIEVLSHRRLTVGEPLLPIFEGVMSGEYAGHASFIEGGTFVGAAAIHDALEHLDQKGDFAHDGEREEDVAEEHDPGGAGVNEDAEDDDPAEEHDPGGAGVNEDAEAEPDGEDDGCAEEAHGDHPKYPDRDGFLIDGETVCKSCRTWAQDGASALSSGTAYRCFYCEDNYTQPQVCLDPGVG